MAVGGGWEMRGELQGVGLSTLKALELSLNSTGPPGEF